jgi:hypothetical protein
VVFLGECKLGLLCALLFAASVPIPVAVAVAVAVTVSITVMVAISVPVPVAVPVSVPLPVPVPVTIPIPLSDPVSRSVSRSASVAIIAPFQIPIPIPISVAVPVPVPVSVTTPISVPPRLAVPIAFPFPLPLAFSFLPLLLPPFAPLLLPPLVLLALLSPPLLARRPLRLAPLRLLFLPNLALEPPLFLFNFPKLRTNPFPLSAARGRLGGVFLVRLGSANPFLLGRLVADLCAAQFSDVRLDGAGVDQRADEFFGLLVDPAAVQGAVDEGGGFAALEGEELDGVALDFLLGDFEDGFGDLGFVVLWRGLRLVAMWKGAGEQVGTHAGLELLPHLFPNRVVAAFLLKGVDEVLDSSASR